LARSHCSGICYGVRAYATRLKSIGGHDAKQLAGMVGVNYHHYHGRMGLEMPFTGQVVETNRPEGWQAAFASWGTLMHAGLPVTGDKEFGKR
jgi:hypothetical protein